MIPKHYIKKLNKEFGISQIDERKYVKAHLEFGNHRHEFYELLIITDGNGIHQIDFIDYEIESPTITFLAPGQIHNLEKAKINSCIVLIFNDFDLKKEKENISLLKQLYLMFNQLPILCLDDIQLTELKQTLYIVGNELKKSNSNRNILYHSVSLLLYQILVSCKEVPNSKISGTKINKTRYFEFLELVENNYTKEHSVRFYAKKMNIDPKRLNQITKIASGENALLLIQKRLLIEAKRQLFYSKQSVKEIAYHLGFEDVSYFSKFFQNHIGVRPTTFQQSNPESTT